MTDVTLETNRPPDLLVVPTRKSKAMDRVLKRFFSDFVHMVLRCSKMFSTNVFCCMFLQREAESVRPVGSFPGTGRWLSAAVKRYAKKVSENRFWLDWLDAALFASQSDQALGFINYNDKSPKLVIENSSTFLNQIPGDHESFPTGELKKDGQTWLLLSCNSSYDREGPVNHWLPCVYREQVSESVWLELVNQAIAKAKVAIVALEAEMGDLELEEDGETQEALAASLLSQIDT